MKRTLLATAAGLAALTTAQAAQAQQSCVLPKDAGDTVLYLMPIAYDGVMKSCRNQFTDASFLPSEDGRDFIEQFREKQDMTWPATYRVAQMLISSRTDSDDGMAQTFGQLDQEQLRPFADALIGQMIAEEIKPDSCQKIDRGVKLMSPLPAENVGGLVSFVLEMVDLGDTPVCAPDGTFRVIPEGAAIEMPAREKPASE